MEKALFIDNISDLSGQENSYDRIYYGAEFCERLIPRYEEVYEVIKSADKSGMQFSFVTPYVKQQGLEKLRAIFDDFKKHKLKMEVVVNDWGVLRLISEYYPEQTPVLGRLLNKQYRGPRLTRLFKLKKEWKLVINPVRSEERILLLQRALSDEMKHYYRSSNVSNVPMFGEFLKDKGGCRLEMDNPAHGLLCDLNGTGIKASVYVPYVYVTTTTFCPTAQCDREKKSVIRTTACSRQCRKYVFTMTDKDIPKKLFLKGNTVFYENKNFSQAKFEKMGIDRLVYMRKLPG